MTNYYRFNRSGMVYYSDRPLDPECWTPVVVIDPEDREEVERLARELMETTDRLQAALREFAKPTPPQPQKTGTLIEYRGDDGRQYFVEPALTGKFQDAKNDLDRVKLAHVVIDGYGVAKNRAGK